MKISVQPFHSPAPPFAPPTPAESTRSSPRTSPKRKRPLSSSSSSTSLAVSKRPVEAQSRLVNHYDPGVFVVERLMARSYGRGYGPDGVFEYQYLVRWAGYGPEHDTWEMRSTLLDGAEKLLSQFEGRDHPFTILESRSLNPRVYLVQYCDQSLTVPPSPLCQRLWHTIAQIKSRGDISSAAVDLAMRIYHGKLISPVPLPVKTVPKPKKTHARALLTLLDRQRFKQKASSKKWSSMWLARWREGKTIQEEWIERSKLSTWFGDRATQLVKEFNDELLAAQKAAKQPGASGVKSPTFPWPAALDVPISTWIRQMKKDF
ncbi:hypothetical protein M231_05679 [Tremella mesenterica]|uniref:Chromo domain-containing protein n=1 Tax=Tremella mesenterica TaxID=5217 RepID=A0A4Q1BHK5_TREME|nr:uncharacterized protein TREMEDRAFT_60924 [Tremella mesenterica DSM 1558]EIW70428.1 hypothetical protein TREMEDRAFT_60924 [Tremella mesenterica DSM 1558]RXK37091.1 hypothetical protein M231_05679 [Tremella mesenterica]